MFFRSREVSRIEQCKILNPIQEIIQSLHYQLQTLKTSAKKKQAYSIDALKHEHLGKIIKSLDEVIAEFNKTKKKTSLDLELKDIGSLLIDIQIIFGQIEPLTQAVIATSRNNQRSNVNKCIQYGLMGTGAAAGTVLAGPAAGAGLACGSGLLGYAFRSKTGLSDTSTWSVKLLTGLFQETEKLLGNIYRYFGHSQREFHIEFADGGKPALSAMQPGQIYIYLENGSIHYTFKNAGQVYEDNLDALLDNPLLSKQDPQKPYQYDNLDSLIFESFLEDDFQEKHNDLEIRFDALSQQQKLLIVGAVYKSLLRSSREIMVEEPLESLSLS